MIEYWLEFRLRFLKCLASYLVTVIIYFYCYDWIYQLLISPIIIGNKAVLVSQDIMDPLVLPLQIASQLSLMTIMPVIIYQVLAFIRPALYVKERQALNLTGYFAVGLFYLGVLVSFYLVEPMVLGFAQSWLPKGVLFLPQASSYLSFSIDMAIAFGVAFEVPVLLMLGILSGWVSADWVRETRAYWVIGIFILAMVLTPPDVYSQLLLAIPMWGIIEIVLWVSSLFRNKYVIEKIV